MDKGNLGFGYPLLYEFFSDVIVHIELTVMMRRGKVAEYKLCRLLFRRPLPNIHDIAHAVVDLAFFKVRQVGIQQSLIQCGFSPVVRYQKHIILIRRYHVRMNFCCSVRKGLNHLFLNLAGRLFLNMKICHRNGEIQHIRRLYIGNFFEHRHEFGNIEKLCKAGFGSVAGSGRVKLNRCHRFSESRSPCVKIGQSLFFERVILQIFLHGVEFYHRIADRCSRCKGYALSACDLIEIPALHIKVGGLLRFGLRDTRHIPHFCIRGEIFVKVCLIHKKPVNTELFKGHDIIFAAAVIELVQFQL